ncbi:unnamed protein product [Urochloa humidicola]
MTHRYTPLQFASLLVEQTKTNKKIPAIFTPFSSFSFEGSLRKAINDNLSSLAHMDCCSWRGLCSSSMKHGVCHSCQHSAGREASFGSEDAVDSRVYPMAELTL